MSVLFTNVSVLDGSGAAPFAAEVLIDGQRIQQIARNGQAIVRAGHEVVDGGGATLMPGLCEAHGHLTFPNVTTLEEIGTIPPEENLLAAVKNARLYLDQGFTSVNSAAAAKLRLDVVLRNAINAGDFPGPRLLAASPEFTVTGGLGDVDRAHLHLESFAMVADGADGFRRLARLACREGVDTVKINPSGDEFVPFARAHQTVMTEEEVAVVCEVAHGRGKRVAVHARSAESVKMSLRQGADIIYHATLADEEALDMLEADKDRIFVAPTIGISYTTLNEASDHGITRQIAMDLGIEAELEHAIGVMQELRKRGVRVLPGGDYGFAWNPHGTNARDLEHFVKLFGFTPMEAIVAATKHGGEIMMRGHELGLVAEGYVADLLLTDGNPLADISILQDRHHILAVMKDGAFHKKSARREGVRQAAE